MNIPGYTAEASLYSTSGRYRASASDFGGSPSNEAIVPAYFPGPGTQAACNSCLEDCAKANVTCNAIASAELAICGWWNPVCAIAAAATFAGCFTQGLLCPAVCTLPGPWTSCCPKVCGFPNPFEPGEGCCDEGENCVDRFDPNARQGCCPSDQSVCGGRCCAKGATCCGNECCPAGWFCVDGFCSQFVSFGTGWPAPPPPITDPYEELRLCPLWWTPCGRGCCAPDRECCGHRCCAPDQECCGYGWGCRRKGTCVD